MMRVSFCTLGCKVNMYETESMREHFLKAGYAAAADGEPADVCIINTCSVTNVADRKSRQYIRRMKHMNPDAVIAVTGCYVQTDPDAVAQIDGVDIIAGTNEKGRIVEFVNEYIKRKKNGGEHSESGNRAEEHVLPYENITGYEDMGPITAMDSRSRALIKIEEGCDRFCSYCIIPYARGRVRSRSMRSILDEAGGLVSAGYREIVLTGINTALYGSDFSGSDAADIVSLVEAISSIEGDFRIRLSSLEPNVIDVETAERLAACKKLCHHMHLSLQSGSNDVLKRMHRRYTVKQYIDIVDALKSADPEYGITTDIIVGFPGETEREFIETMETAKLSGFSRIHVFRYSPRKNTPAANMPAQVPPKVKAERSSRLSNLSDELAADFFRRNSDKKRRVLFEGMMPDGSCIYGYTDNYIKVYVPIDNEYTKSILHGFAYVTLDGSFRDGMTGTLQL